MHDTKYFQGVSKHYIPTLSLSFSLSVSLSLLSGRD